MRSSFVSRNGFALMKTPRRRQQANPRRILAISAVLGLALASGMIGALTTPKSQSEIATQTSSGPFSYFPHQ